MEGDEVLGSSASPIIPPNAAKDKINDSDLAQKKKRKSKLKKKKTWAVKDLRHRDTLDVSARSLIELSLCVQRESKLIEMILLKHYGIDKEELELELGLKKDVPSFNFEDLLSDDTMEDSEENPDEYGENSTTIGDNTTLAPEVNLAEGAISISPQSPDFPEDLDSSDTIENEDF